MHRDNERIEKFCQDGYEFLKAKDGIKRMLLQEQLPNLQKEFEIKINQELLRSIFYHLYYLILNNKVFIEINQKNIEILRKERKIMEEIHKEISDIENDSVLYLLLQKIDYLNQIDELRLDYVHTNSNIGRTATTSFQLSQIQKYIEQEENLKRKV